VLLVVRSQEINHGAKSRKQLPSQSLRTWQSRYGFCWSSYCPVNHF
jgi:hypothetical protein